MPSVAFFENPSHNSPAPSYIRHSATSEASNKSVMIPARRNARGSLTPSCIDSRIAAWPPARS